MLPDYLNHSLRRIDNALNGYLPEVNPNPSAACPLRLASAIRYSVLGGGKRLRPVLCLMAAEACGGQIEAALPAACALEMVHAYSLIHDDLPAMDDDDLRRGRSTCHRAFDEATAILAGDALLTLAFDVIAHEVKPETAALHCVMILADAAGPSGMLAGQIEDLRAQKRTGILYQEWQADSILDTRDNLATLEYIHRRKTGAILRAALRMGATIAGATDGYIEALDRYGKAVGLAFQIIDDLLDIQGNECKLGKRVGKDANQGKWTYPRFLGVEGSRNRAQQLAEEAIAAIEPLGSDGERLSNLALILLERDR